MVSWDFGSRLVERLDMVYVRVWPAVWGVKLSKHLFLLVDAFELRMFSLATEVTLVRIKL